MKKGKSPDATFAAMRKAGKEIKAGNKMAKMKGMSMKGKRGY